MLPRERVQKRGGNNKPGALSTEHLPGPITIYPQVLPHRFCGSSQTEPLKIFQEWLTGLSRDDLPIRTTRLRPRNACTAGVPLHLVP